MKKIHLINIGCKVNFAETSRLKEILSSKGYEIVENASESDAVLINTCTVTNKADADCRKTIRKARKSAPNSIIAVFGCYAQLNKDELIAMDEVQAVFGSSEKFLIPELIEELFDKSEKVVNVSNLENLEFHSAASADTESRSRAFLKIQDGCDYNCTYCTIPLARGSSRGISFKVLTDEINKILANGYREIVLSGINLAEYRGDNGERFIDVVKLLARNDFGCRFRISSIEPNLLSDEIIEIIAESPNLCPHFHIPLQSGSNAILRLMKRRYNTELFKERIEYIKERMPDSCIGADVICGFPGETEQLFEQTYRFLEELPLSYLHIFTYSERKNTPAVLLPNPVPNSDRKNRTNILRKLSEKKLQSFYLSQIGKYGSLLPENFVPNKNIHFGHTENYVKCSVKTQIELENKLYKIEYMNIANDCIEAIIV